MDAWVMESFIRKAFDGLNVDGLSWRTVLKMFDKAEYLLRILRGEKISPQEAQERACGFTSSS